MDEAERALAISDAWLERQLQEARSVPPTLPVTGICRVCGKPIPAARMRVHPTALACVPCLTGDLT